MSERPGMPWKDISDLPESDDLFWFLRYESVGGYTEDGPRRPQTGGYDADEWQWFAPCESPPIRRPDPAPVGLFNVAMTSLQQIADTPRNAGARRNAKATLRFIQTQQAAART